MKYIHKLTLETLDVQSKLAGDWVPFDEFELNKSDESGGTSTDANAGAESNSNETNTDNDGLDGVTITEIKQELDALGIKYNPKAKKLISML